MIRYPEKLNIVFDKLISRNVRPVIVGGYVRDYLLGINSKDIDIELYNISSYAQLENILSEFGSVNVVGKSFGVCKLYFEDYDLDFSFPRKDNKTRSGHKGFEIVIDTNLDFKEAASRRDFTINSIGYDVADKKILDPHGGVKDLEDKILRAVDINSFGEDPLRVLRAVQFSTRFDLKIEKDLFNECKDMVAKKLLDELPKERVFEEIKKLLLWAKRPSIGFELLKTLKSDIYTKNGDIIDEIAKFQITNTQTKLSLMLAALCYDLDEEKAQKFILRFTNEKELLLKALELMRLKDEIEKIYARGMTDYDIYRLSAKTDIENLVLFGSAVYMHKKGEKRYEAGEKILKRAKELEVLHSPLEPLLKGRDIMDLGMKPSALFSKILEEAYDAQMRKEFADKSEALKWLAEFLKKS